MNATAQAIRRMFESVSLGAPEHAVGFVLWRITARYQREADRALQPLGLTNLQFVTLALCAWFSRNGESIHQAQIARFGGIHPMQLSQMLKALESKGFVRREPSNLDLRAKQVEVTVAGLQSLREALPLIIAVQGRLFGKAGLPDGSLHQVLSRLDRELAAIDE